MASGKPMDKRFGERVRIRRDKNEWTQPHMAEQLEMHPTVLAKIEKGLRPARVDEASAIADLFGVTLDSLLGRRSSVASEVADILSSLQHAASRAWQDVGSMHGTIEGWYRELGDLTFDGREDLEEAGGKALKCLKEAQDALFEITLAEAPERTFVSRIDEIVAEQVAERIDAILKNLIEQEGREDEA